jgi:two-component system, OmpR family, response regulator
MAMATLDDLRVLLVEDSPVICRLITGIIDRVSGVKVTRSVDTEADAIDAISSGAVDVVVLDLQLRRGSGFGVLRAVRRMTARPTVVVLTNFAHPAYRESTLALGAGHFLDKSKDYDRLPLILTDLAAGRAS